MGLNACHSYQVLMSLQSLLQIFRTYTRLQKSLFLNKDRKGRLSYRYLLGICLYNIMCYFFKLASMDTLMNFTQRWSELISCQNELSIAMVVCLFKSYSI